MNGGSAKEFRQKNASSKWMSGCGLVGCRSARSSSTSTAALPSVSAVCSRSPHRVLPVRPGALTPVALEVGLGAPGQVSGPGVGESGARLLQGRRCPVGSQAPVGGGGEPAVPAPMVYVLRDIGALTDPADADIAVEHLPALLVAVLLAAAGEGGQAYRLSGTTANIVS